MKATGSGSLACEIYNNTATQLFDFDLDFLRLGLRDFRESEH